MKVIITSGGTREPIDNVRSITNSSSGKLGAMIAEEFFAQNKEVEITYIHGPNAVMPQIPEEHCKCIPITTVNNLMFTLFQLCEEPDIVVHSMAVSDYKVKELFDRKTGEILSRKGKVNSNLENPCIALEPTPKIIDLIKNNWSHTFLVGFKLLDCSGKNSSEQEKELFDIGFNMLRRVRANLVLANDISQIRTGKHNGLLIYPEKTSTWIYGKKNIAKQLVEIAIKRQRVGHHVSVRNRDEVFTQEVMQSIINPIKQSFYDTGKELYNDKLLPQVANNNGKIGTYGNMSARYLSSDKFIITGRNVHKGILSTEDLVFIESYKDIDYNGVVGEVGYVGYVKPSIDAAIHYHIYKTRPDINAIIHVHTDIEFDDIPSTNYNFPCGCHEEVEELINLIIKNPNNNIFQMIQHGLLILGSSLVDCREKMKELFSINSK